MAWKGQRQHGAVGAEDRRLYLQGPRGRVYTAAGGRVPQREAGTGSQLRKDAQLPSWGRRALALGRVFPTGHRAGVDPRRDPWPPDLWAGRPPPAAAPGPKGCGRCWGREARPSQPAPPQSRPGVSACLGLLLAFPEAGRRAGSRGVGGATWWRHACLNLHHRGGLAVLGDPVTHLGLGVLSACGRPARGPGTLQGQLPDVSCGPGVNPYWGGPGTLPGWQYL